MRRAVFRPSARRRLVENRGIVESTRPPKAQLQWRPPHGIQPIIILRHAQDNVPLFRGVTLRSLSARLRLIIEIRNFDPMFNLQQKGREWAGDAKEGIRGRDSVYPSYPLPNLLKAGPGFSAVAGTFVRWSGLRGDAGSGRCREERETCCDYPGLPALLACHAARPSLLPNFRRSLLSGTSQLLRNLRRRRGVGAFLCAAGLPIKTPPGFLADAILAFCLTGALRNKK